MPGHESMHLEPGMVLEWSDEIRNHANFKRYVALAGEGPFADYEITSVSPKPPVYGDERFRDGMRVPEKLISEEARRDEARQVGAMQRVKIHLIDSEGHRIAAEFPASFFKIAKK